MRTLAILAVWAIFGVASLTQRVPDPSASRIVDLTHAFGKDTIYWPTSPAKFSLQQLSYGKTEGGWFYSSYSLCTPEHGGTHLDAPIHFAEGKRTTDQVPLEQLIASAVVIDITAKAAANRDYRLTVDDVAAFEKRYGRIAAGTIVLLRTGWSRHWPDVKAYLGDDTPGDASKLSCSIVDEDYFDTIGLPILAGRGFRVADSADAPTVAVVNEVFAQRYWPGQDAVGKRFRLDKSGGPWVEIVGVAKTSKYSFAIEPPMAFVYLPYRQRPAQTMFLLAESVGDPSSLAAPLRDVVRRLDVNLPISNVRTMEELYQLRSTVILDVITTTIGAMGMMGLALAIVGLYGLVAYAASRRTREIGIRMAIGADRFDVFRMVLQQGMVLALVGLGVGLLGSAWVARAMGRVFPGGPAGDGRTDFVAFALVTATVFVVTLLAAYAPARRASHINPIEALRQE